MCAESDDCFGEAEGDISAEFVKTATGADETSSLDSGEALPVCEATAGVVFTNFAVGLGTCEVFSAFPVDERSSSPLLSFMEVDTGAVDVICSDADDDAGGTGIADEGCTMDEAD